MTTAIALPEETDRQLTAVESLIVLYEGRELEGDDDYQAAGEDLKTCKALAKEINEFMGPIVTAAHAAHKAAKGRQNETLAPIEKAQAVIGRVMGAYQVELAAARKIAEAQERARLEQEAAAAKDQYVDSLIEHDKLDEAEAVTNAPPMRQEPKLPKDKPKVAGTTVRTNWLFEIVNASAIPREYLIPDERCIGAVVRSRAGQVEIPGVRVYSETKVT
jgi:hypothetical protein